MSIESEQAWLGTPLGAYLREREQELFDNAVSDVFGFNALQLGMPEMDLLRNSRMPFLFKARSEEHTSELQSLMRISYAVFCLKKKINKKKLKRQITHYLRLNKT